MGIPGLPEPVSKIVLGGPFGERSDAESFGILDRFVEWGGTVIETAHSYAGGAAEEQIGRWLKSRMCRDRVVLLTKLCHPKAHETPTIAELDNQLRVSLERLGVEYVDITLLHRDPTTVPTTSVLAALERRRSDGDLRAYGLSNVTGVRLEQFDHAAEVLRVPPLAIISNYFGLAHQAVPPWPGTVQLDEKGIKWLERNNRPLLCWSALAQGWFAHRELPAEFRSVYDTYTNASRRDRADQLATERGLTGLQVALAYLFSMPFDTLASVGPRSIDELDSICAAESLILSKRECAFLRGFEDYL